jgi:hypothetical protein
MIDASMLPLSDHQLCAKLYLHAPPPRSADAKLAKVLRREFLRYNGKQAAPGTTIALQHCNAAIHF